MKAEVRPTSDGETQTLTVHVDPGARVERTVVKIDGNQQMPADQIETLAGEPESWRDPGAIQKAITDWYRSNGWLDAVVTVADLVFEGATASLPITIAEGPLYHVSSIAVASG